ncbi:glycosyltransferase [Rubrivirga sp. S365]|uniref:glycosyltransferase n=1 Tax=Rubrivirga sp. S365 TaxID=3076080 RepID=UPI0028CAF999|nr:glycosyltransferase [Rubrivirga sp. S365]MDT7856228.1 glycosyltransferase [Rubrivirga sp. S365]
MTAPPDVLHLATTHTAGDPRVAQKEAGTLAEAGLRVGLVLPHDGDGVGPGGVAVYGVERPATGRDRVLRTTPAVVRRALAEAGPRTVFHLHDADLLAHGLALALRGRRVVYDAHEDTPRQALHQPWIPARLRRPAGWAYGAAEALGGRLFAGVVAAEPAIARRYPAAKTALVRNFPLLGELAAPGAAPYAERPAAVAYVGSITRARGAEEMARAVAGRGATLHLAGPFHPPALADAFRGRGGVVVHGVLDRPAVAALLGGVRAGLSVLHPTPKYLEAYPTKLFEYMAAGLPLVASDFPVIRQFVEPAQCGILVDPLDVDAIGRAVGWILDHPAQAEAMGARGRAAVESSYTWAPEGRRLVAFYDALQAGRAPGQPIPV